MVEVRQGTLTWIAVEQEEDEEDEEDDEEEEERRTRQEEEEATDIKSNNPHLVGGEKLTSNSPGHANFGIWKRIFHLDMTIGCAPS